MIRKASCRASPASSDGLPVLTSAAAGLGAVNWTPQRDQVLRRIPLLLSVGGTLYPSLPLETLRVALKETTHIRALLRRQQRDGLRAADRHRAACALARPCCRPTPTASCGCASPSPIRADTSPAHTILDGIVRCEGSIAGRDIFIGTSAVGPPRSARNPARFRRARRRDPRPGAGADACGRPPHAPGLRHRRGAVCSSSASAPRSPG